MGCKHCEIPTSHTHNCSSFRTRLTADDLPWMRTVLRPGMIIYGVSPNPIQRTFKAYKIWQHEFEDRNWLDHRWTQSITPTTAVEVTRAYTQVQPWSFVNSNEMSPVNHTKWEITYGYKVNGWTVTNPSWDIEQMEQDWKSWSRSSFFDVFKKLLILSIQFFS